MNDTALRSLYGIKYNPFLPDLPEQALQLLPGAEIFARRVEAQLPQGGFALITGEPGQGKSKTLHLMAKRLARMPELAIGIMQRPQSLLADFYREMGEMFAVPLSPANRYGGFKALRARWKEHCRSSLLRPVLLIDEAQELSTPCLTELRLMQSEQFDSRSLLFTLLCGDTRLPDRFRSPELMPLGSRIRARVQLGPLSPQELQSYLETALDQAGHPHLMSPELIQTLCAHSLNNLRVLTQMAAELLAAGAERNLPRLDESLFFELFSTPASRTRRAKPSPTQPAN
jgi:type II secretory pathway predicted ATPase ExeA